MEDSIDAIEMRVSTYSKKYFNNKIEHLEQKYTYDCGVACLKMVVKYAFKSSNREFDENSINNELVNVNLNGKSLWTIDIAYLLARLNIRHSMFTKTLGVLDDYSTESFYTKLSNFDLEKQRINKLFTEATSLGINVQKKSVNIDEIKSELNKNCACVVLIDSTKLHGTNSSYSDIEQVEQPSTCCLSVFKLTSMLGYCGHFIVLIGYDEDKQLIFYRNPATPKTLSYSREDDFETARKAFGTDEDIVFVYA